MNTQIEHRNLFSSKEEYQAFVARWKELARAKKLTARDCLLRCVLLQQDIESVMPVTKNEARLANGAAEDSGRVRAARELRGCDPVAKEARRLAQVEERTRAGRPVPEYLLEPGWEATWVDLQNPGSFGRGLTATRLRDAASLAQKVAA